MCKRAPDRTKKSSSSPDGELELAELVELYRFAGRGHTWMVELDVVLQVVVLVVKTPYTGRGSGSGSGVATRVRVIRSARGRRSRPPPAPTRC